MRLSGRVTEKWSGVPVVGAVVTVNGATALTDGAGNFTVDTQYSPASLQVLHVNHEAVSETVMMNGDTNVDIVMTPVARAMR